MLYPNRRYGYHQELGYWMQGRPAKEIPKRLNPRSYPCTGY